jgi:hypothetical protein
MICSSVRPANISFDLSPLEEGSRIPYGIFPTNTDLDGGLVDILVIVMVYDGSADMFEVEETRSQRMQSSSLRMKAEDHFVTLRKKREKGHRSLVRRVSGYSKSA